MDNLQEIWLKALIDHRKFLLDKIFDIERRLPIEHLEKLIEQHDKKIEQLINNA